MNRGGRWTFGLVSVAAACALGALAAFAPAYAFGLAGAALLIGAFAAWGVHGGVAAAILATWLGRAGLAFDLPTTPLSYADFVLVPMAALLAWIQAARAGRRGGVGGAWLLLVWVAVALSAISTGTGLVRSLAGALLLTEPFLVVYALTLVDRGQRRERLVLGVLGLTMLAQIPFALWQWQTLGVGDPVQGTLVGAGAGAHVLGGGVLVAVLAYVAIRPGSPLMPLVVAAGLILLWLTDAKQVIAVVPIALAVIYLKRRGWPSASRIIGAALVAAIIAFPAYLVLSQTYAIRAFQTTVQTGGGKIGVIETVEGDVLGSSTSALFGFGAGNTVSRLSQITSTVGAREGSPAEAIGLEPSARADYYAHVSRATGYVGESSASAAQTSLVGVVGDYGLVGMAAYLCLVGTICRRLWGCVHPLAGAALAGWIISLPLGLIADWIEQPPFMLLIAALTGVALARQGREQVIEKGRGQDLRVRVEQGHGQR